MSKITEATDQILAANSRTNAALDNVAGDVNNQAKRIQDLIDQLAAGTVSPADLDALAAAVTQAKALADKAKVVADITPDLPAPPPTV